MLSEAASAFSLWADMIVSPKIRGFICTTAHPTGCAKHVADQIAVVKKRGPISNGPKKVLVIGSSTGYGLSSRIAAAFGNWGSVLNGAKLRPFWGVFRRRLFDVVGCPFLCGVLSSGGSFSDGVF